MASSRGTTRVGVRTRAPTPVVEETVPNSGWTEDSAGHYLLVDLPEFRREEVKLQVDSYGRILVSGERQVNEWKHVQFRLNFPEPVDSDMDKITGKFDGGVLYVTVPKRVTQQNKESEAAKAGNSQVERAENDSHNRNGEDEKAEENDSHQHGNGKVERLEENDRQAPNNADVGRRDPSQHDNHAGQEIKRNENEHIGDFPEQVMRNWDQESMLRTAAGILRKNKGIVITAVIAFSLGLLISRKFNTT
ncbi:uncharacterized protein LOC109807613 [Cajanus cajan]|uniref:uncharacterized protein LOC109807613 n=1 Tax=Cajanus cajan TaxID=3821 RepID=UPI00098DB078|nr:uncharacterized protein LOC109807613 [Cajanus cajan]